MELQTMTVYRRNVLKTLSVAPAKAGLRHTARNTSRTNAFHAAVGLSTEVGELLQASTNFLLVGRYTEDERSAVLEELGDIGYYLTVLARVLHVKTPASTKRVRLVGTPALAMLELNSAATNILSVAKKSFYGVSADALAQRDTDDVRKAAMVAHVADAVQIFWPLCLALTGHEPSAVFAGNIAKLSARYGEGMFTTAAALAPHNAPKDQAIAKAQTKTKAAAKVPAPRKAAK